ncbi:glycosyltransferase family 39 protein [Elioraea tepidiphila]|uniref:glycosyltransferase family 39 protein n=1 Tax=Elioraea tepidiphila TaxID=457934 RepID=UPI000377A96E|nr:glycosyltransferase family 39 protein [Elioraea tepidiphila]
MDGRATTPPMPFAAPGVRELLPGLALILALAALFFVTSPRDGAFWWSDAPRHALNGIFLKDFVLAAPIRDPIGFAEQYYLRYPALTILFYPPLLYVLSAPFFLVFGDSHAVAQAVIALHLPLLGLGTWLLARLWLDRWSALAAAVLLLGMPEILLWGRQVMLEIPGLAYLVWTALFTVRHARDGRAVSLLLAVGFALATLYTKLNMAFVMPALGLFLLLARGRALLASRVTWIALALAVLGLVPLIGLQVLFGQANLQSVAGIPDTAASRATLAGWLWYAARLPEMTGILPLPLALLGLAAALRRDSGSTAERLLPVLWFVFAYLALSFVELKEARHGVILLVPIALWAAAGLAFAARGLSAAPLRIALPLGVALVFAGVTFAAVSVPQVAGYREAALRAAALAPPGTAVLFSGTRDGAFVFNMRTVTGRPDLYTLRADKLLLRIAVRRELGVAQADYTEAEIATKLAELGVGVVVAQPDFWTDLEQMARLQRVLEGEGYEEVARIPLRANIRVEDRELRIYRARGEVRPTGRALTIELPIIGRSVEGQVGGR